MKSEYERPADDVKYSRHKEVFLIQRLTFRRSTQHDQSEGE